MIPCMPTSPNRRVTVAGKSLQPPRHICCFFDSRDEQYDLLIPYLLEGLTNGERLVTIMDREVLDDHLERLKKGGLATQSAHDTGQMCTLCSEDTYLAGGTFSKQRMRGLLEAELASVSKSTYAGLRTCGDMRWVRQNMPEIKDVLEYESEVNALLDDHDATFMCIYDSSHVSGRSMVDILATHSCVIIGNVVYENPYFMKPEEYRHTLMARRSALGTVPDDLVREAGLPRRPAP